MRYAQKVGNEEWISRLLVDATFADAQRKPTVVEIDKLINVAQAERKAGRTRSATIVLRSIWTYCLSSGEPYSKGEKRSKKMLDSLIEREKNSAVAVEELKIQ